MPIPLLTPRHGVSPLIATESALERALEELAAGSGPIAIDAERASGFRYSQRAYLIQIFRRGSQIYLIDPIPLHGSSLISQLNQNFSHEEWVIHASTQDLPCLREFGIQPQRLFDTELGARLAGFDRVGLGPLTESILDFSLAKEHSAVDWSKRPLLDEWLNYAALDVDVLLDLRDAISQSLTDQAKLAWAYDDFSAILKAPPPTPRKEPWRRTSGMHKVRHRKAAAYVKALWERRDQIARDIDIAPGRLLNDSLLIELAMAQPRTMNDLLAHPMFARIRNEVQRSHFEIWLDEILAVDKFSESQWPDLRVPRDTMPPTKIWKEKFPLAYARYTHARAALAERAEQLAMPAENLLTPDHYKRICWASEQQLDVIGNTDRVADLLESCGARPWQIAQTAALIATALTAREPLAIAPETSENGEASE